MSWSRGTQRLFCKISVRRSKNCLKVSMAWGGLKISRWPFHSCTIFETYLVIACVAGVWKGKGIESEFQARDKREGWGARGGREGNAFVFLEQDIWSVGTFFKKRSNAIVRWKKIVTTMGILLYKIQRKSITSFAEGNVLDVATCMQYLS